MLDVAHPLGVGPGVVLGQLVEHLGEADDRVERGAQLVAHAGQELALEAVALEEPDVGLGELADLEVEALVHRAKLGLAALDLVEHRVEGLGELLELVAGLDLRADGQVAGLDLLGRLPQPAHGLQDELGQDQVEDQHRHEPRCHPRGNDVDAVAQELAAREAAGAFDHEQGADRTGGLGARARQGGALLDRPDVLVPERPSVPVDDPPPEARRVGVLGPLPVGAKGLHRRDRERVALGDVGLVHVDHPRPGRSGRAVVLALGGRRSRLQRPGRNVLGQPQLGELAGRLELALAHEHRGADPGHAQHGAEDHQDRGAEEQLALVGKADPGEHDPSRV